MIRSFKHRGLKALYYGRTAKYVAPEHLDKLRDILAMLDQSRSARDVDLPGFRLHPLRGSRKGEYAVSLPGNWRATFGFEEGHAVDVDYVDYH